jgi:hypothetical protein
MRHEHPRANLSIKLNVSACNRETESGNKPRQINPPALIKSMTHAVKQNRLKPRFENQTFPEHAPPRKRLAAQNEGLSKPSQVATD